MEGLECGKDLTLVGMMERNGIFISELRYGGFMNKCFHGLRIISFD
jgi:hypothetical protein